MRLAYCSRNVRSWAAPRLIQVPAGGCQALQGFAVDGRKVRWLAVSLAVRGRGIRPGPTVGQMPRLVITFYDERRAAVGQRAIGPWRGTFPWQQAAGRLSVPPRAREAIMRIGLLGAVGKISFDDVQLKALKK